VHDPLASAEIAFEEYGLELTKLDQFKNLDALILAVNHREYLAQVEALFLMLKPSAVFVDVKSALSLKQVPVEFKYWSL
jgi:UDP-N-acetyl-D-glucosamine/UDP-N-acetyl-D-galactosamine dehydrogenase